MAVQHLFNSSGKWLGFRAGRYVFSDSGEWIGWLPWDDSDVVDRNGQYLGTIINGNRLYRFLYRPDRAYPGYLPYREYQGYPQYPGDAEYSPLPAGAQAIEELEAD